MSHFADDLRELINRKCRENGSNTPDFVLGEFLWRCLDAFDAAVRERDCFHHLHPTISKVVRPLETTVGEQTSTNTGSPKLPLLEDVLDEIFGNREACGQGAEYVKQTFCIIERQLRAGA